MAAGFDAIVNERANRMTWPKGQMRYNIATLAELRTFRALAYTLDLDGQQRARRHAGRHRQRAVVRRRAADHRGALLDDGLLDVVIIKPMSKAGLVRTYPKLFKGTHVTHPQYEHHRCAASPSPRRASSRTPTASGSARCRCTVECVPGALNVLAHERAHSGGAVRRSRPPTARTPSARTSPRTTPSRSTTSRSRPAAGSRTGAGCWSPPRPGRARPWSASSRSTWPSRPGRKCFYTTPIKALSNQKYNDLVKRYGADKVGLLTGDNSINGEAPIVVMTTEVLRNMLYAGSRTLLGPGLVVMDEVHYLADRFRGAVWEEVIIHLPESVALVSLSATVSNAEEFGEWLGTVRGDTTIVEERRPVPLYQHVMVGNGCSTCSRPRLEPRPGRKERAGQRRAGRLARDDWASARRMK